MQVSIQSHPKEENWKLLGWWWASGLAADLPEIEDPLACKWFQSVGQERGMEKNRLVEDPKVTKKEINNKALQKGFLNPRSSNKVGPAHRSMETIAH